MSNFSLLYGTKELWYFFLGWNFFATPWWEHVFTALLVNKMLLSTKLRSETPRAHLWWMHLSWWYLQRFEFKDVLLTEVESTQQLKWYGNWWIKLQKCLWECVHLHDSSMISHWECVTVWELLSWWWIFANFSWSFSTFVAYKTTNLIIFVAREVT